MDRLERTLCLLAKAPDELLVGVYGCACPRLFALTSPVGFALPLSPAISGMIRLEVTSHMHDIFSAARGHAPDRSTDRCLSTRVVGGREGREARSANSPH